MSRLIQLKISMHVKADLVVEYEIQLLNIGLFYLEYQDWINEGDEY